MKEFDSLKDAIAFVKERLIEEDISNNEHREWYKENMPEKLTRTMEEDNWNDKLYLAYRNDFYDDTFYIFEDENDIESWFGEKWSDWDIWDYSDPNRFLEETVVVWEFHRDICKEKWAILYTNSKPFINGWSRKKKTVGFEAIPSFSIS